MKQVLDKVRESIEKHHLLAAGDTVVVGVSGGPDSLCLLHVLCRLRSEYALVLHVAHLNHGLRDAEGEEDAGFVRDLAADWGLPVTIECADVLVLSREHRLAIEEAARRARYSFLNRVAQSVGADIVAVGHNADDQAETVLMHWIRGSGLAGLRGMLPLTRLSDYRLLEAPTPDWPVSGVKIVRPLLEVSRDEVEAYCDFYGLEPRFDRSNLDTTYFRNWLRHEVLPLLASHNPNVREVIRRSARVIADDYTLLRSLVEDAWPRVTLEETTDKITFDLMTWRALPASLQRSTLREAIQRLRRSLRDVGFLHVENAVVVACDGTTGDQATLPQGLMLTVGYERLTIADASADQPLPEWPLLSSEDVPLPVNVPGRTLLPASNWVLEASLSARSDLPDGWEANVDPWRAFLDAQSVGSSLCLRTRQSGDRFQPLGMAGHTVKLADFLTNQKVPQLMRDRLPLLVGEHGIAWVCGQRIDERSKVRDGTTRVLGLRFHLEEGRWSTSPRLPVGMP